MAVNCVVLKDGLYHRLASHDTSAFTKIKAFIEEQDYDTEALLDDMDDDVHRSNLYQIGDSQCYQTMRRFLQVNINKFVDTAFQIGFDFKYWDYYKHYDMTNKLEKNEDWFNINNNGGYSPHQLYVDKKYNDLKDEILNNKIFFLNVNEFNMTYQKTNKLVTKNKKIYASDVEDEYHYNIIPGTPLSHRNILSVAIYEDWTELCTAFGTTFNQKYSYETLFSVKNRNREFWHLAKILKETVQYFGSTMKEWDEEQYGWIDGGTRGPYFYGLSFVMLVPQFSIRLYGPMTCSREPEVANRFAGEKGIVLMLSHEEYYNDKLRVLSTSWISNFAGEDAHLCFGGHYRMKLEGIRDISTTQNFQKFNNVLYLFDCMLNGSNQSKKESLDISDAVYKTITNIIQHRLGIDGFKNKYPKYINDIFRAYTISKKQIVINLWCINKWFRKLKDLVIDSKTNAPKAVIIKLFENINKIIIYSTSRNGKHSYPVKLKALLSLINSSLNDNIVIAIKAKWPRQNYYGVMSDDDESNDKEEDEKTTDRSWIFKQFKSSIKSIFDSQNIATSLSITGKYNNEDCLIISKQPNWFISTYSSYNIDLIGTKISDCSKEEILFILEHYAFQEAAKRENKYKEPDKEWSLKHYKNDIIRHFKRGNFNGKKIDIMNKMDFVNDIVSTNKINNKEAKTNVAVLYKMIKSCNVNKILSNPSYQYHQKYRAYYESTKAVINALQKKQCDENWKQQQSDDEKKGVEISGNLTSNTIQQKFDIQQARLDFLTENYVLIEEMNNKITMIMSKMKELAMHIQEQKDANLRDDTPTMKQIIALQQKIATISKMKMGGIEEDKKEETAKERLQSWFTDTLGLPQYFELFIDEGYEDLDSVKYVVMDDLDVIGIKKHGHKKRIIREVHKLGNYKQQKRYFQQQQQQNPIPWRCYKCNTENLANIVMCQSRGDDSVESDDDNAPTAASTAVNKLLDQVLMELSQNLNDEQVNQLENKFENYQNRMNAADLTEIDDIRNASDQFMASKVDNPEHLRQIRLTIARL